MDSKFKKKRSKTVSGISTASLPDIIFILLFFFMVSTVLREQTPKVKTQLPKATELTKLKKKSWVSHIHIGPPTNPAKYGTAPRIQLNDALADKSEIIPYVETERLKREERIRPYITFSLKIDQTVKMGIVTDVKQELRKANQLKINYAAVKREDEY